MADNKEVTPSVGILIYKDDKVLLVKEGEKSDHVTGVYNLPSGRLRENETEPEATVRELREETGLETTTKDLVQLPKTYSADIQRKNGLQRFTEKVFICTKYSGELKSDDETVPEWIKVSDLKKYKFTPNTDIIIRDGLKFMGKDAET